MTTLNHRVRWPFITCLALIAISLAACKGSSTAPTTPNPPLTEEPGPVKKWGYISLPGGGKMRYSVILPASTGSYPVLIEYDGYSAGAEPTSVGKRWVAEGYAVMGLSVPGTACSPGDDHIFDASVGAAGAQAVEWAAKQTWSTGKVGMVGYSYAGFDQLWVAAQHPAGLVAIAPGKDVADIYRDVAYPGGIENVGFPSLWWSQFPLHWAAAAKIAKEVDGDTDCEKTVADNIAKLQRPDIDLNKWLNEDHYYGARYAEKSAVLITNKINIPTLGTQAWQDEEVGTRMGYYEETIAPDKMWLISSNGDHHTSERSDYMFNTLKRFYAHFLKGENNGFEQEPHVHLLQEMQSGKGADGKTTLVPTGVTQFDRLPIKVTPMRLWLQPGGGLNDAAPATTGEASRYPYPVTSPAVNNPQDEGWGSVKSAQGQATFTTPALTQDLSFYGEGSADLWLSTTAVDTDVQVTLSEVRPDGMEMFVQRGWLRASQRQMDGSRSGTLRAWGDFTQSAMKLMMPNEPALLRLEILKFSHIFREGSSIRITVDTPSQTGYWQFGNLDTASTNTIWHDPSHPSSIVLGYLPYSHAKDLPKCGATQRQPCRKNEIPVPVGKSPRAPM
ncbi:CocE/NonD family hydrolase [Undibacterium sp. Di26W]|uniref:CocE/NonD family hydrolase n=1 Tax=Undibacterium sp. Di26W TaxID=3413035 RepID=UPI003BF36EBF